MTRLALVVSVLLLAAAATAAVRADAPSPASPSAQSAPPIVVMGSYKCDRARVGEVDEYVRSVQAPVMQAMVEEGWLLDWGYLAHHYGDEWNRVVYYVSATLARHVEFSAEVTGRLAAARPGEVSPFTRLCFEHKDNIYDRIMP